MSNLDRLHRIVHQMGPKQARTFRNILLGVLSHKVDEESWAEALDETTRVAAQLAAEDGEESGDAVSEPRA